MMRGSNREGGRERSSATLNEGADDRIKGMMVEGDEDELSIERDEA